MASGSTLNHDGMMLLEAPFARVPHDELRSYLRTQQRFVERDLTFCSSTLQSLAKSARGGATTNVGSSSSQASQSQAPQLSLPDLPSGPRMTTADLTADESVEQADVSAVDASTLADVSFAASDVSNAVTGDESTMTALASMTTSLANKSGSELERSLDLMIGRIKGLKRKLVSVHESTGATLNRLEARTTHLDGMHRIQNTASPAFDEWCRTRLDRMLVDWMLRKGFSESAEMLAKNRNIEPFVDLNLFAEIARIEASLFGSDTKRRHAPTTSLGEDDGDGAAQTTTKGRSCAPSLAWCSENKAALRKIHSTLEFDLRLQEFIELTRQRTPESLQEAIVYSRRYLLPYLSTASEGGGETKANGNEKEEREEREQQDVIRTQVARSMGLLACGPSGAAYEDLYSEKRWQTLQGRFRSAALQIHSLPPQPLLNIALSAGLSSLKLPACYADQSSTDTAPPAHLGGRAFGDERSNLLSVAGVTTTSVAPPPSFPPAAGVPDTQHAPPSVIVSPPLPGAAQMGTKEPDPSHDHGGATLTNSKNDNCPVCDANGLGVLAKEVPWSHHANSTLVCAISGRIMDENDPPMALPNGRVYSLTALQEMAANSATGDSIVCPRTGTAFTINQIRKVYIS